MATTKVNHQMIALARESRGLTQTELAKELGVTQGKISKMEQDLLNVSDEMLQGLSKILGYPEKFFFSTTQLYAPGIGYHRKRAALTKKTLNKIDAVLNVRRIHLEKLLHSVEFLENKIPTYDTEEHGSPEEIARLIRQCWFVPRGAIQNLTKLIEDAGGVIFHCDFETSLIDGLSINIQRLPPIIFVNKDIPGDRLRFTLAHELGHIVMHRFPHPDMEIEADRFASEFLMPANEIRHQLSHISFPKLASLKPKWKVAMAALLMRASQLGKITDRQSRYLWMQFSKAGYKRREPPELDIPKEKPFLLKELLDVHFNDLGYTISELCEVLAIEKSEFESVYLEKNSTLRLVKNR